MKNILKEIIAESINYNIEKNLDDFYIKSSEHPNYISRIDENVSWVLAKKADWPDCIFKADFENLKCEKEIIKIKELIRKGKAPNGWTIGPLTKPKNLGIFLEKSGFSNVFKQSGMAVELKDIEKMEVNKIDLIIEKVDNEELLIQWSEIVSQVFSIKVDLDLLKFLFLQEEVCFYLGKFEGKFISTLMLYLSSGVAGLHAVSTLSEYRSRGFSLAISRDALLDAYNLGYNIGVLQASSMGERVYRKLGFQKFCDINSYALEKE